MVAVAAPGVPIPRLPIGRGRPGTVEAGLGPAPGLPSLATVAWFRGSPAALPVADTDVIARTIRSGVDAGVPVVGVLGNVGIGTLGGVAALHGWGSVAQALAAASGLVPTVLVVDGDRKSVVEGKEV